MSDKLTLKSSNWKIKTEERSRGRMKLTVKLNKEETETFTVWKNTVKPTEMLEEDFYRRIFFGGINTFNKVLEEAAKEALEAKQNELGKQFDIDLKTPATTE